MTDLEDTPCGPLDASQHQTALNLLAEVADYLSRLPVHPLTHALLRKVQSHLNAPGAQAQAARLAMLADSEDFAAKIASGHGFSGASRYNPVGLAVVQATVLYPVLRLDSPAIAEILRHGRKAEAKGLSAVIGSEIARGVSIDLSPMADH